jgi:hypothetical protein
MQDFLAHTSCQPTQPIGSLYPVQQRPEKRKEPIFRILPSQPASNHPPAAQPHIKIVNSSFRQPVAALPSVNTGSEDSSPFDCRFFHTAKGCRFGTHEFPELCKWVHSAGVDRELKFGSGPRATDSAEPPAKRWRTVPNRRPMVSFVEHPETKQLRLNRKSNLMSVVREFVFNFETLGGAKKVGTAVSNTWTDRNND